MNKFKEELRKLIEKQKYKDAEALIMKLKDDELFKILKQSIVMKEGTHCLIGVLTSLSCKTRESSATKLKLYEKLIKLLRDELDSQNREQGEVVTILMMQADNFPSLSLTSLISYYLDHIISGEPFIGRWTDLLSKLITLAASRKDMVLNGKDICGEDYLTYILSTLCSARWCSQTAVSILLVIKDLNLPKEELMDILEKGRKVLGEVDFQSVPPIVYHLVLLGQGKFPGSVLELVMDYFNKQDLNFSKKSFTKDSEDTIMSADEDSEIIDSINGLSELKEAQSTVVLHIIHLAQYDPGLVRDYIKVIRNSTWLPQRLFTPFNIALTLSLAYIDRYKEQIIDSLKSCILKYFRQEEKQIKSLWLREAFKGNFDITASFRAAVENCKGGWDQVSQGLVLLCFSLLESGGGFKGESYPSQQTVGLASKTLPLILKKESHLASSILKQLSGFILTASTPTQYIDLLGRLVKISPLVLLDHISILRELLEQLGYLPLPVAAYLLQVLLPLFKISMTLKDALMLILRKMLFSKRIESRQAAVQGFLQFLRHFKVIGTLPASQGSMSFNSALSQISADIHSSFDNSTNEALCLELLGVLRRCFSQQCEVRSTLYFGLFDVSRTNPKLSINILSMLHQHLVPFLDLGQHALNPILLEKTISTQGETTTLIEPIGELIECISLCKAWFEEHQDDNSDDENDEETISILNNICSMFDILTERLAYCDMDDLGFGSASFLPTTSAGKKNLIYAELMIGVFDALTEQSFYSGALKSENKMKTFISLFKTQRKILDLVRDRSKVAGKKGESSKAKGRPSNPKMSFTFKTVLSLKFARDVLSVAFKGDETSNEKCVEVIQNNNDLQIYMIHVVDQTVVGLKTMLTSARDRALPYLKTVAHLILIEAYTLLTSEQIEGTREQNKLRINLSALHSLISAFVKYYKDRLPQIFKEIAMKPASVQYCSMLYSIIKKCQRMLLNIFQHEDQSDFMKEATTLIQIMNLIAQEMDATSRELKEFYEWIDQVCKDHAIENPSVTESLLSLLFSVHDQISVKGKLPLAIAREIHFRLGDSEQDISVEECGFYKIVTELSAHTAIAVLINYCDDILSLLELTLQKLRATVNARLKVTDDKLEPSICTKFASVIQSLHEIIKTSLPQGSSLDMVLKTTTKVYNGLTSFVRYYLDYYRITSNPQMSEKFEKLVHISANMLKEHVFKMIKYVNNAYLENNKKNMNAVAARAIKESKLIPALVFSMEHYEKQLIQLSKKSKINLMANMKASTSRDFRIKPEFVEAVQRERREEEESEGGDKDGETEAEEEPNPPPIKKRKLKK